MNANKSGQTHDQLQAACYKQALQEYHPFLIRRLFSVPNDMAGNNAARARHYQAIGVTAGVWDMQLNWFEQIHTPDNGFIKYGRIIPLTVWFEFKVGRDKLSDSQIKFRDTLLPLGHKFYIIGEQEEFMQNLKHIVEPTLHIAKQIWKEKE